MATAGPSAGLAAGDAATTVAKAATVQSRRAWTFMFEAKIKAGNGYCTA